jgi:hypothetical protein
VHGSADQVPESCCGSYYTISFRRVGLLKSIDVGAARVPGIDEQVPLDGHDGHPHVRQAVLGRARSGRRSPKWLVLRDEPQSGRTIVPSTASRSRSGDPVAVAVPDDRVRLQAVALQVLDQLWSRPIRDIEEPGATTRPGTGGNPVSPV